jgi:hypothetical protein
VFGTNRLRSVGVANKPGRQCVLGARCGRKTAAAIPTKSMIIRVKCGASRASKHDFLKNCGVNVDAELK